MTYVLLAWTSDTINLLSHRHPLHFHDTVLTLLYFTEEMRSPKTHRLLNTNACYCRARQKNRSNLNPGVTGEQGSLNSPVTQDIQSEYTCAWGHIARPIAQDFCQGNPLLSIQHRDEEEREELQDCPVYANNVSTAVEEQQNWSKQWGGESWSHLTI